MNILILGHMRHGKTTMADMLNNNYALTYMDSSEAAAEIFIYDELKDKYGYKSFEECLKDRKQHRPEWYDLICDYNSPDKSKLAKEILKRVNIYVGMRSNDELQKCVEENLFDLTIGIYRSVFPLEPKTSFDINIWESCDFIIPNDGTLDDLNNKIQKLIKLFI